MKKICLNMIVKNEAKIIERCLKSVLPIISSWVIVDTGSTDDTIAVIERFFLRHHIPGEIHHVPFENFEQARNAALFRARASTLNFDYLLFIDADMELVVEDKRAVDSLQQHAYRIVQRIDALSYANTRFVRRDADAVYSGVTHEFIKMPVDGALLNGLWIRDHTDGGTKADRLERDMRLLQDALAKDPTNARYVFYTAQTLGGMGRLREARRYFSRRARMAGWDQEVWYSLYQVAQISHNLGSPKAPELYLAAYAYRPTCSEPLIHLAQYHRERSNYALALMYARAASHIPMTQNILFCDEGCYTWRPLDEIAVVACHVGAMDEGREAMEKLLRCPTLPPSERSRIEQNALVYRQPVRAVA